MEPKDFSLDKLSELSPEGMAKTKQRRKKGMELAEAHVEATKKERAKQEKEAHAEWVEGFKKRKKAKEEEKEKKSHAEWVEGFKKRKKAKEEEAGWDEAIKEAKKRLEEEPENIKEATADIDDKFDFSDVDVEEKKEKKKIRKELVETKPEDKHEARGGSDIKRHLRANLLDYPELLQPEIKKNLQTIAKNENIIEQNKGNAKKSAQDKIKKSEEIIERAQAAVDGYVNDLVKQYYTSQESLIETSQELWGEQVPGKKKAAGGLERQLLDMAGDKAGLEKNGLFGGIKNFFSDRKLKKQLGDKWDEFEVMRSDYQDKLKFYNNMLASHTKRFSKLEEVRESGTTFRLEPRGLSSEKLPRVRGR